MYTVDQICGYWSQTCHNSLMEELVAMTTSGDDTSEGAKGEEGEVHMYMYIELR